MSRIHGAVLAALLAFPASAYAQETILTLVPGASVAEPDGVAALLHNPAGLATLTGWELRAYNTQLEAGLGEGTALLFGMPVFGPLSLGAAFEHVRPPLRDDTRARIALGAGFRVHRILQLGIVWRHLFADKSPDADGMDTVDLGLLLRPARWFGLGFQVRDLNTPRVGSRIIPRTYGIGLAFRPGTDRVTLEAGLDIVEDGPEVDAVARVRGEPWPGIELVARVAVQPRGGDIGLEVGLGLAFHFGMGGVEGGVLLHQPARGDFGYRGFTVGARLSGARYPNLARRTGRTVVVPVASTPEQSTRKLLGGGGFTFTHLVTYLRRLETDPTISGVVLRDRRSAFGWAQVEELRDAIARLKKAGKRVSAYLDQGDNRHAILYAAVDDLILNPAGGIMLTGLSSTTTHFKDALDKLLVDTQWVKYGKYKSAPESFSLPSPSAPAEEVRNSLLDALYGVLVDAIAAGRKMPAVAVRALVDGGPYVAAECKSNGLVDHLGFWDEVPKILEKASGGPVRLVDAGFAGHRAGTPWGLGRRVAVIPVVGQIVEGNSRRVPLLGTQLVGADTIVGAVQSAAADPRVVGIVLRIDSPGGSSTASDAMHRAIFLAAKRKPVVASFGNVAASGGYYLAMGARKVLAEDATITGSIGIFMGKPSFGRLFRFLGIGRKTWKRGTHADLYSTDRPWTPDEIRMLQVKLRVFYDLFLKRVARNRKMTEADVHKLAQGRVWTGAQARERKLVDARGGVADAVVEVKRMAGLSEDAEVELVFLPHPSLIERVRATLGVQIAALVDRLGDLREALADAFPFLAGYAPGDPLALMPFRLRIR